MPMTNATPKVGHKNSQKESETVVANKFLSLLNDGWTISDDNSESPDFVLTKGMRTVGLELTSYREQGAHNEADSRDCQLCQFIGDSWHKDTSVNHFQLALSYRESNDRFLLPKKCCWNELLDEVRLLARSLVHSDEPIQFSFDLFEDTDEKFEQFVARQGRSCLPAKDYPILCRHFRRVVLRYHPNVVADKPTTSLSTRWTGADTSELQRVLESKIKKAKEYRSNLPANAELWLLIHNDGWPMSANISIDSILKKLLQTAESVLRSSGVFVRAYWLTDALIQGFGSLHSVYPSGVK